MFYRVATHYGTKPFKSGSNQKLEALRESSRSIERFSSLALTTSESLAYVYENTLIFKQTRSQLGTHSTPSYLIDYILGHLSDWIEEIPETVTIAANRFSECLSETVHFFGIRNYDRNGHFVVTVSLQDWRMPRGARTSRT